MNKVRIKICCISSLEEAQMAINAGASALGLVGHMPSGPGVISDDLIKAIAQTIPPPIASFLLTSETKVKDIIAHQKLVQTNTVQIVDYLSEGSYENLRAALPGVKLVQVIHVLDEASVKKALEVAPKVDALLLDSGNPNLKVKKLGGTGKVHDWQLSRKINDHTNKPVFLAGGINASNVRQAIEAVEPFGIDLCSGVRENGLLKEGKLKAFFDQLV